MRNCRSLVHVSHMAPNGFGDLAIGPRPLQWLYQETAGPMDTRLTMAVWPLCELVKLVICEFAILNDGVAYQKKFAWVVAAYICMFLKAHD